MAFEGKQRSKECSLMRHLVTGGSGFLGNLITRRLRERGHFVRTIDILADPSIPDGVEFVKGNIQDLEAVWVAMQGIDVVHHTAALVPVTKSGKTFRKVNVEGSRIVAEAAARSGAKGFIHMSSSAVFGIPAPARSPTKPQLDLRRSTDVPNWMANAP
jgi:nucleoside-diphosphate-sugar epimerase